MKKYTCENESEKSSRSRHRGRHGHGARKERVLHTRISEQLSEDIRQFAEDLRVPASNLVRNVLEEVFTVADGVSGDVGDLFDELLEEAEGVRERVRNQADSRRRHSRGPSRGRRRGWGSRRAERDGDGDVEAEFRQDEEHEEKDRKPGTSAPEDSNRETPGQDQEPEPTPRAAELFPEILGWQPLVLNRDFECGRCQRELSAGESAFLGIGEQGLTRTALCGLCAGSR